MLKHELQLLKWRSKLKLKVVAREEFIFPEQSASGVFLAGEIPKCDISLLPESVISQVRMNSCIVTSHFHNVYLNSGFINFT